MSEHVIYKCLILHQMKQITKANIVEKVGYQCLSLLEAHV